MNTPILVGTGGALSGASYAIDTQGLRIGRDPNNEVHLDDPDVSRHHARVILYNGALWVQDAGSRNGVFVNENRISTHKQVGPGDAVRIGTHEFRIDVQVPMQAAPVAQLVVASRPDVLDLAGLVFAHADPIDSMSAGNQFIARDSQ